MHHAFTQALSEAHMADLHREAAHYRLTHAAAPRAPGVRTHVATRLAAVRLVVAGWVSERSQPDCYSGCCPA